MDGSTKNSYKVSTKILQDNCIRIRVKVASCVCFSIFPTALKCQTMEKHTQSTQNPQDPKRPLRTVCGNVNDTRLRCEHNKYIDSFIRLFVTPSPLPAPPASDGLIHGHSLCVYSIRYQFSSGQQQKPSLLSVFFFSLPHLRLKLFVCSLWLSVYLSLCPLRFLFHWLLRRVSFNFNMCAVAPCSPPRGHPVAVCFLFSSAVDDAIPCRTGHWRSSLNFERPRKTICAMGAYQGYQVRCEVVLSLQTMKFSFV